MPRVDNITPEGLTLMRWRSLPNSCVWVDPQGRQMRDVPAHIAYSDQAKALADRQVLRIEGYSTASTDTTLPGDTVQEVLHMRRDRKARRQER